MRLSLIIAPMVLLGILSACDEVSDKVQVSDIPAKSAANPQLEPDAKRYTRGLKIYQQTCAACHGRQGEGAPNWQKRDANGKYLPPPLNGTGHTWHHPMATLVDIINNGTQPQGGNMPPWKDKLTDVQIQDILFWLQSQWPTELYVAWYKHNQEVLRAGSK